MDFPHPLSPGEIQNTEDKYTVFEVCYFNRVVTFRKKKLGFLKRHDFRFVFFTSMEQG